MNSQEELLGMSLAMFVGAFGLGFIPFLFSIPAERLRQVTVAAAGLLVGTALIVILPEGVHMWIESRGSSEHEHSEGEHEGHEEHNHEYHEHLPVWQIGLALAAGFVVMLVIERVMGSGGIGHGHSHTITLGEDPISGGSIVDIPESPASAMAGLVLHSAVDGVAIGASVFVGNAQVSMVIFMAIMLHKAPAALGFVVFLMQQNHKHREIKKYLLIFSLAAPVGALFTFYGLALDIVQYRLYFIAIIMLFSAGTFLFVSAVHILPEIVREKQLSWLEVSMLFESVPVPICMCLYACECMFL
eukprot:m.14052 g.14052  ORF g.14052 m.14052 type:complete len:301 (+) comp4246_c0_seq1:47-949(+)